MAERTAARSIVQRIKDEVAKVTPHMITGLVTATTFSAGVPSLTVNVNGMELINLPVAGNVPLVPGMKVSVLQIGTQYIVVGEQSEDAWPRQGTVSATSGNTVSVQVPYSSGSRTVTAVRLGSYTPTVGDVVLLDWVYDQAVILGKLSQALSTSLTPPFVPPAPPSGPNSGSYVVQALDSGTVTPAGVQPGKSMRSSADESTVGMWWYGPGSRITGGVSGDRWPVSVEVYLDLKGDTNLVLFTHAYATREDTQVPPTVDNIGVWDLQPPFTGWLNISGEVLTEASGSPTGFDLLSYPYLGLSGGDTAAGVDVNPQSGALRITWTK